jgi:hypothetical protein
MIAPGASPTAYNRLRAMLGAFVAELRRLNNARMAPHELRELPRAERTTRVKVHLAEHHRGQSRCC